MRIFNFKQFESYLGSGRHLLYHTMRVRDYFKMVFETDTMKPGLVSRGPKGICFSRSINWTNQEENKYRIVLDSDLLRRDGYKIIPLQELAYKSRSTEFSKLKQNVWKGSIDLYKKGRIHPHNINGLRNDAVLETEFEERILEPITNVGKYILYIDFSDEKDIKFASILNELKRYLVKYAHIKVRIMDQKMSHNVKEVDLSTINVGKEKVKV